MELTNSFLKGYNRLDKWMREEYHMPRTETSFSGALDECSRKNNIIKQYKKFLKKMGDLRNVIVHDSDILANPREPIVAEFLRICAMIYNPPSVLQIVGGKPDIFKPESLLCKTLPLMKQNNFSQVIIRNDDNTHGLVTREGISMWVEANIKEDIVSISEVCLADIQRYESPYTWCFLSKKQTIYDARECFISLTTRLQAAIITENGKSTECPLGIITSWDMINYFGKDH